MCFSVTGPGEGARHPALRQQVAGRQGACGEKHGPRNQTALPSCVTVGKSRHVSVLSTTGMHFTGIIMVQAHALVTRLRRANSYKPTGVSENPLYSREVGRCDLCCCCHDGKTRWPNAPW